jgi:hypothetical protein
MGYTHLHEQLAVGVKFWDAMFRKSAAKRD